MMEEADHFFFFLICFFLCRVELTTSLVLSSNCLSVPLGRGNTEKEKGSRATLPFIF